MSTPGNIQMEIIDLENTSGTAYLAWVMSEGTVSQYNQTDFTLKFNNLANRHSIPVFIRGMGPSTQASNALLNPCIDFIVNGATGFNDDWVNSPNSGIISSGGYAPTGNREAAEFRNPFFGNSTVTLRSGSNQTVPDGYRARIDLIRSSQPQLFEPSNFISGDVSAWLNYNLTGLDNKIFAFTLEIVDFISGHSGVNFIVDQHKASELLFYSGVKYSGVCEQVDLALATTGLFCNATQTGELESQSVCVPTGLSSGAISQAIQQTTAKLYNELSQAGAITPQFLSDAEIEASSTALRYVVYSGQLEFNDPVVGDRICFRSYNFDYTGNYNTVYGVNPPYSEIGKCWYYGVDYSGIDGLITKINQDLYNVNVWLWNRDLGCATNGLSGYFESGSLLKASKTDSNTITLEAQRVGRMGAFEFTFFATGRTGESKPSQNSYKYLWPRNVSLRASNDGISWTTLDSHSNISWDQARFREQIEVKNGFVDGFSNTNDPTPEVGAFGVPKTNLLYTATVTGNNRCGASFTQDINFIQPVSGFACAAEDDWDEIAQSAAQPKQTGDLVTYGFLKTGWKFNQNTGYNFYQVALSNFYSSDLSQRVINRNEFYVSSINFYRVESGQIPHSGVSCLYGSSYTGQVMGLTTGQLSGILSGQANASGFLCFDYYQITGTPINSLKIGSYTVYPASQFTGMLNTCVGGTGYFIENIVGYYWNTSLGCVSFSKPVTGLISGNGNLSGGPYQIIKDSLIPTLLTGTQFVSGSGVALHSGVIANFSSFFNNVISFYSYTGSNTGIVTQSGCLTFNNVITFTPPISYSYGLSGTYQALNLLLFNSPATGDTIFINETPIIYQTVSGYEAPTYFSDANGLNSIINSGSGVFGVTGEVVGSNLLIRSVALGASGNGIPCETSGAFTFVNSGTVSGDNVYYSLTPVGNFTGYSSQTLCATQFITTNATGEITGRIKQLDFVREFTGIWNISSGDIDFRANSWVMNNNALQNAGFLPLHTYSGRPYFIPLTITYENDPIVLSSDLAKLTISGYNIGTTTEMILSGQF